MEETNCSCYRFFVVKGNYVVLTDSDSIEDKYAIEEFMKFFAANSKVSR